MPIASLVYCDRLTFKNADALLTELEGILIEAKQLIQDGVFSRESFRTFIETYNIVWDTLKHKKEEATTKP